MDPKDQRIAELEGELTLVRSGLARESAATCAACRAGKVKCDRGRPCKRCVRLAIPCVATGPSRRGKRPRALVEDDENAAEAHGPADGQSLALPPTEEDSITGAAATGAGVAGAQHFGVLFLVREFISIAVRRRSLMLLSKAIALAARCGWSLDEVLAVGGFAAPATGGGTLMGYIQPLLLQSPVAPEEIAGPRLELCEFPMPLLEAMDRNPAKYGPAKWSIGRVSERGIRRWYVSAGFERDIASWDDIQQTYLKNENPVHRLWISEGMARRFLALVGAQVGAMTRPCGEEGAEPPKPHYMAMRITTPLRSGKLPGP